MLSKTEKQFPIVFFIIVVFKLLTGNIESLNTFHYVAKPAIVLSLIVFFIKTSEGVSKPIKNFTLLALIFSLLGDVLLMFVNQSPHFFTFGLVAFLIAHIMYVAAFLKHRNKQRSVIGFLGLLILYAAGMFYFLKDGLGAMLIPVVVYMAIILSMATTAYLRKGCANNRSYNLVFIGAIFFMISDSILALNKFYQAIPLSGILIIVTYALAQYLIVMGILKLSVTNADV